MSTVPTTAPAPTPAQVHHSWLQILLSVLRISAAVAPAAALPFVGAENEQLIQTEASVAIAALSGIGGAAQE